MKREQMIVINSISRNAWDFDIDQVLIRFLRMSAMKMN
jgi:hypothetical protein